MPEIALPFDPLRDSLYGPSELFEGFSAGDPDSYARCPDIAVLSYFVRYGKNPSTDSRVSTLEALHDNSISTAAATFRARFSKVAAIMGGHGMKRAKAPSPYSDVATIAYRLAQAGFLVVSGGGPGAMEASHLGAALLNNGPDALQDALGRLALHGISPQSSRLLSLQMALSMQQRPENSMPGSRLRWRSPRSLAPALGRA